MRRFAEFTAFVALALIVHLITLSLRASDTGLAASGEGGEALMSLQASTGSIEDLVEKWEKPPETASPRMPTQPAQPTVERPNIALQQTQDARTVPAMPRVPGLALPHSDPLPDTEATAPPPLSVPPVPLPEKDVAPEPPKIAAIHPQPRPERPKQPVRKAPRQDAKRQSKSSAANSKQSAAGQGGGQQAGPGSRSAIATLSKGQRQTLMSQWGAQVRARIERRKHYPRAARGASGTVRLHVTVASSGALRGVSIARSSGNAHIDQAGLRAVQSARKFPPAPRGLTISVQTFTLLMNFGN
ncbi:TonB family protein [Sedimentitalea todarodis]|uniref:TonB family protein n=1 Tax=Sedimentitalea todarodis TaxID=1631240 RepID=A0ABU3VBM8_9RHOB|nr:TonB family protein [Sedimentitalea todarodis]MDU9003571.1 TonB family protein [Sedimentitalea todarodis]